MNDIINPTFQLIKERENKNPEYLEYRRKWFTYPPNFVVEDFPLHLDIELNTTCNLRCTMCFQSTQDIPPREMDLKMVKNIISQAAKLGVYSIKLNYRGEPSLYSYLKEVIEFAKKKGILEVILNTNGTLLVPKMVKMLARAKLDLLIVTIDGTTKEVYEEIRVGADFETVLTNAMMVQSYKQLNGIDKPLLRLQIVKQPANEHQIDDFVAKWCDIADEVSIVDLKDVSGNLEDNTVLDHWYCSQLWHRLFVLVDGDVVPCCRGVSDGIHKETVLGNVKNKSIKEMWHSDQLYAMRNLHRYGKSHLFGMCRKCGIRKEVIQQKVSKNDYLDIY